MAWNVKKKTASKTAASKSKKDLYQTITDQVIADLESGTAPWCKPWINTGGRSLLPINAKTKQPYTGINILMLWAAGAKYETSAWLTYKQAQEMGGQVRGGEKSVELIYVGRFTPKAERERAAKDGDDAKTFSMLKSFRVFNIAQIDGLPEHVTSTDCYEVPEAQKIDHAEELLAASGVPIENGHDRACYIPSMDLIHMPAHGQFKEQINYYNVVMHELTHATGHRSRLDRTMSTAFGTKDYAREELVAEMGAAFLCAELGIQPTIRHADYIGSWLKVLKEDNKAIVKAASMASKAAKFVLDMRDKASGTTSDDQSGEPLRAAA